MTVKNMEACSWGMWKAENLSICWLICQRLSRNNSYLLIIIFWQLSDDIILLKNIRNLTNVPILVLKEKYDGSEKISLIEAGADEYLSWPENPWEAVASCRALIRRYTVLNRQDTRPVNMMLQEDVIIDGDYRSVFIRGKSLQLTRREFDLFCLLASYPERVFTYERLLEADQVFAVPEESLEEQAVRGITYRKDNTLETAIAEYNALLKTILKPEQLAVLDQYAN